jgi:hypothetical protein
LEDTAMHNLVAPRPFQRRILQWLYRWCCIDIVIEMSWGIDPSLASGLSKAAVISGGLLLFAMLQTPLTACKLRNSQGLPVAPFVVILLTSSTWIPYAVFNLQLLESIIFNCLAFAIAITSLTTIAFWRPNERIEDDPRAACCSLFSRLAILLTTAIVPATAVLLYGCLFGLLPREDAHAVTLVIAAVTSFVQWCAYLFDVAHGLRVSFENPTKSDNLPSLALWVQLVSSTLWTLTGLALPDVLLFATSLFGCVVAVVQLAMLVVLRARRKRLQGNECSVAPAGESLLPSAGATVPNKGVDVEGGTVITS